MERVTIEQAKTLLGNNFIGLEEFTDEEVED